MPERALYDEAMLLSQARLKVQDPDLKQGNVEMFSVQTARGSLSRPWGVEGGFAVVYKFRTQSGKVRALRCFRVPINPDTQFRYERIGAYFSTHAPHITAEFKYYAGGIVVKETVLGQLQSNLYPIIDMEWIEGVTLLEHIDKLCRKRDQVGLGKLADRWVALLRTMRQANIAHGDLAGANVMVRTDGRLVLVDYDGVYIPDFAGLLPTVAGQPDYQHPQMNQRPFNERTDAFSALVIYTALLALQAQPALWDKYTQRDAQGELLDTTLLFEQEDFLDPDRSLIIREIEKINDARVQAAIQELRRACRQSIIQVQFPFHIIDPDYDKKQAVVELEQAIKSDDDEKILNIWGPLLENYGPAQRYFSRVEQAKQNEKALQDFRNALQKQDVQQIVGAYTPPLDYSKRITKEERERLVLARSFVQAHNKDDDEALVAAYNQIQNSPHQKFFTFTPQEVQRINLARQRSALLAKFRLALASKNIQQIAACDASVLNSTSVTPEQRDLLRLAQNFVEACAKDDDQAIVVASDEIQNFHYRSSFILAPQEVQRISLAQRRSAALAKFRLALASKRALQIAAAYDPLLDDRKGLTQEERERLALAHDFAQAYQNSDDQAIASSWSEIQESPYQKTFTFTSEERQRVALAQERRAALVQFRAAVMSRRVFQILYAYDSVLDEYQSVTQDERDLLQVARNFVLAYNKDDDEALASAWDEIQSTTYRKFFSFTAQEQERIALAQKRSAALKEFRKATTASGKKAQQVVAAYDPVLDASKNITQDERILIQSARNFMKMYQSVLEAIRTDKDEQIALVYDEELALQFTDFNPAQEERINKALRSSKLERALQVNAYGLALRLAREIEIASRKPLTDFRLTLAKQKYVKQFDAKDVEVYLQGGEVIVRWQWPSDDLIQDALIVWRTDRWPQHPKREEPGTGRVWVSRSHNEQNTTKKFRIGQQRQAYIQVYLAIPGYDDQTQRQPTWFFSNGHESSSRKALIT